MILLQCTAAYMALIQLAEQEWDYKSAYALLELKRKLQPQADFFSQKEMELVNEYGKKGGDGKIAVNAEGSSFTFENPKDAPEYARRRAELGTVEVREEFEEICLEPPACIKPVHIEALAGFVRFGEGGK